MTNFRRLQNQAMDKKPTLTLLEDLIGQTKEYIDNRIELLKLKTIDKASNALSLVISGIVLFIFLFIFFIFLNIGLALFIGDLIGKSYAGFLIVGLLYAIAGFLFFRSRKKLLTKPITNSFIRKFF